MRGSINISLTPPPPAVGYPVCGEDPKVRQGTAGLRVSREEEGDQHGNHCALCLGGSKVLLPLHKAKVIPALRRVWCLAGFLNTVQSLGLLRVKAPASGVRAGITVQHHILTHILTHSIATD